MTITPKENRKIIEEMLLRLDEVEKGKEPLEFKDIDFDDRRKINTLWLGKIVGVTKIRAYLATADQTIGTGSATKVALNAEDYDIMAEFDSTTNYRFTAKKKGHYIIIGSVNYKDPVADKIVSAYIYKNGSVVTENSVHTSSTSGITVMVADILSLDAGDYIELYTEHNTGANEDIEAVSSRTFLSIHKIS